MMNNLTRLLDIALPIVQAPMFGVTTPAMVAAAANTGALGSLAIADLSAQKSIEQIRATRQLTAKPFAVNLFVHTIPPITATLREQYTQTKSHIEHLAAKNGLTVKLPELDAIQVTPYQDQIDAIISEQCRIVSFTFGIPDAESIQQLKANNTILIGTCTSVAEAIALEEQGIDIICVQGIEAGGHRGSFIGLPQIGGFSLLPQVYDTVKTPLIYAGGIYNKKSMQAALALGAQAVSIGSLLIASKESALLPFEKERLSTVKEEEVVLTRSFSGRFARGIHNTFIQALEGSDYILPYPYQNKLTGELRRIARAHQDSEFVNIWLGQSIQSFSSASTAEIINQLTK
ncbi:nitronate monooxygenase [Chitinophaga silvisoli]|uniref:Propionate 3-nitronate monooxygenase n=1 Tax=Chitinophaga silvisoli TaxID=2291814 RepID=A0A3E1NWH7_9BACT|nr:nitronate monooxygenase [Chitinophaga silvisoli]